MCTVLLPPGDNPTAVNKYISYHISYIISYTSYISYHTSYIISYISYISYIIYHIIYHIIHHIYHTSYITSYIISYIMSYLIIYHKTSSGLHVKYRYCCQSLMKFEFYLVRFSKNTEISNFTQCVQWEPSCSLRTDGRTDGHDKANSRFSQFCENRQRNHTARRFMQDIRNVRRYELDTF